MIGRRKRSGRPAGPPRPGTRGWSGRGGGASSFVQAPEEWRGTTFQVCGLWPYAAGSGTPMVGVPLGRNLLSGATLCADPISWFQRARLISNPSLFLLGLPGLGKSTLIRRMALGLTGYGVLPMALGDLKPDYVDLIEAVGGQVIRLGRGRGRLNILDPGEATDAARRLVGQARAQLLADAHGRRHNMVAALITIQRQDSPTDHEDQILDRAIRILDDRHREAAPPVLGDLVAVLRDAPQDLREVVLDRGDMSRYHAETDPLLKSLTGLLGQGRLGEMFADQTTTPMRLDRPVVFDVSSIDDQDTSLQAAALMACWSTGFAAINVANALADAGLAPQVHYFLILDELWRALRAGRGMVDRVDALTRLNRQHGVGVAMITHTMSDLDAVPDEDDRAKARGFVERAGMVVCGGLPDAEMEKLRGPARLSRAEQDMLVSWMAPPAWNEDGQGDEDPPGRGNFLVKVGGRPGIPVHVSLTEVEGRLNDTNRRWYTKNAAAAELELPAAPTGANG